MSFEVYELGDLCDIRSSKRIYMKDYVEDGIPFYRSKEIIQKANQENISTELFISEQQFLSIKARYGVPIEGDILLTSVGTLGIPYLVDASDKFYFKDGNLTWFSNFDKKLNNKFLYYWFTSNVGKSEIDRITIGSTQKALTMVNLKKIMISIPPLNIQNTIVHTLESISRKLTNNLSIIRNLEEVSQTIFKRWFIDFEYPNEEGQPYKSSGAKMVDSELGEIPEGWQLGTIGDIGSIIGGGTPSKKEESYYTENGISWITPKDLSNNKSKFIYRGAIDITELGLAKGSAKLMPEGSVLFSSRAPIGYIAFAGKEVTTNQGFKSVVCDKGYSNYFIYFVLHQMLPTIEANAGGSTFKEISGQGLKSIAIVLPPVNLVREYTNVVKAFFEQIKSTEFENFNLINIRNSLLPKLLSGEIEIPDESVVV
ncbi:restriction endonuclease subunit S [Cytobacillus dafuensis]|uniref:Restriction endonuclease subunit S n=1 Tax=Cytobacillus dafuensis TaxID=1742359 RepID=A0A5B8YZP2_CYTDA|nr:restriction endonuclease subunit S [Cytobacillus dafuensis]QED46001.1 restriction endonuclease subunit S [Cytobacillus dafuensis]